jgi:hypothetical protein
MKYFVSSFKAENVYKNKGKRQFGLLDSDFLYLMANYKSLYI